MLDAGIFALHVLVKLVKMSEKGAASIIQRHFVCDLAKLWRRADEKDKRE